MTNQERAQQIIAKWIDDNLPYSEENDWADEAIAEALADAGLLRPDLPRSMNIIRTAEDLEALDPDAVIETVNQQRVTATFARRWTYHHLNLPAVVLATGEQVRAAREALEDAA